MHKTWRPTRAVKTIICAVAVVGLGVVARGAVRQAVARLTAGPKLDGTAITSQGWGVAPAGQQVALGDKPYALALSPDGKTLLVSNDGYGTQSLMVLDRATGKVLQTIPYAKPQALYLGLAWSPDGQHVYAAAGANNKLRVYAVQGQQLTEQAPIALPTTNGAKRVDPCPAGLAISPDGKTLYVADNLGDALSIVNLTTRTVTATVAVGRNPYAVLLTQDGRSAVVSNWGEQSVSVVDLATHTARALTVGTHPNALALNMQHSEIYVANGDSDTISVLDANATRVMRTIALAPRPGALVGCSPNALAVAPDGSTLYVANAGNNDVAVIYLVGPSAGRLASRLPPLDTVAGLIPTAWYPTSLALSPDGNILYVANAKGLGAGPNGHLRGNSYIAALMRGTLSIIPRPDAAQLARYSQQVLARNHVQEQYAGMSAGNGIQPVPLSQRERSPIQHVFYIIKENRSYDQVLGDLARGNNDPSLTLFGSSVTPNQHELARRFVTLDNFYADSEVSADGWNWSTGAYANTYVQKNWPQNYGGRGRPYEFEGGNYATSPNVDPKSAFLWNRLDAARIAYRNYGFWVNGHRGESTEPVLASHTDLKYTGFSLAVPDQQRVDEWLSEFRAYAAADNLPPVELLRLPNDHTAGTRLGSFTPKAYVADNDLALGRIVEAISHSRYWPTSAIFVVEDDAQNGIDHVDAHRTVAQVISPYTQHGMVDSTFYDTAAMLRTMELILGLPPMTQFDAAATPMRACFAGRANPAPYNALTPAQVLTEQNGATAPLAALSAKQDFSAADRVPDDLLNLIVWQSVRGAQSHPPATHTRFPAAQREEDEGG